MFWNKPDPLGSVSDVNRLVRRHSNLYQNRCLEDANFVVSAKQQLALHTGYRTVFNDMWWFPRDELRL